MGRPIEYKITNKFNFTYPFKCIIYLTKTNSIDTITDRLFLTLKDLNKILLIDLKAFSKRDIALIIKKKFFSKKYY